MMEFKNDIVVGSRIPSRLGDYRGCKEEERAVYKEKSVDCVIVWKYAGKLKQIRSVEPLLKALDAEGGLVEVCVVETDDFSRYTYTSADLGRDSWCGCLPCLGSA